LPARFVATHARFAVLDLGSTTFQLLVADADAEGSLTPVLRDRVVLNLGRVLAGKGRIPDEVAARSAREPTTSSRSRRAHSGTAPIARRWSHCSKERSARRSGSSTAVRRRVSRSPA
jgi:hypothetical protein